MAVHISSFGTKIKITDGATIVELLETSVTPGAKVRNDKIEQTSARNTAFRSYKPGDLVEKQDISFTAYFSTDDLADINTLLESSNVASILITFGNGNTITDNGWLVSFTPSEHNSVDPSRPTADFVISLEGENAAGTDAEAIVTT